MFVGKDLAPYSLTRLIRNAIRERQILRIYIFFQKVKSFNCFQTNLSMHVIMAQIQSLCLAAAAGGGFSWTFDRSRSTRWPTSSADS